MIQHHCLEDGNFRETKLFTTSDLKGDATDLASDSFKKVSNQYIRTIFFIFYSMHLHEHYHYAGFNPLKIENILKIKNAVP